MLDSILSGTKRPAVTTGGAPSSTMASHGPSPKFTVTPDVDDRTIEAAVEIVCEPATAKKTDGEPAPDLGA